MQKLFKIDEISDLYVDSYLVDENGHLIFCSFWGRDITINEFIARITLNDAEYGIRTFHLIEPDTGTERGIHINNKDSLEKQTGRVTTDVFGEMIQGFLYEKITIKPDLQSGKAMVIFKDGENEPDVWSLVKEVSHLPLVDHWKKPLLTCFSDNGWISTLRGVGVNAIRIEFEQDSLEVAVSNQIKSGKLTAVEGIPAPDPVIIDFPTKSTTEPVQATKADAIKALKILKKFIGERQLTVLVDNFRCEEKQFFFDKAVELANTIESMPVTYETEEKELEPTAFLHFFIGNMDWYISELDKLEEQHQAFGVADMGYPEYGYISIVELIENNVELDFHFTPQPLEKMLNQLKERSH